MKFLRTSAKSTPRLFFADGTTVFIGITSFRVTDAGNLKSSSQEKRRLCFRCTELFSVGKHVSIISMDLTDYATRNPQIALLISSPLNSSSPFTSPLWSSRDRSDSILWRLRPTPEKLLSLPNLRVYDYGRCCTPK
jgi:hypothetical protein